MGKQSTIREISYRWWLEGIDREVEDADRALEELHRTHDERWPARMCDLCRPVVRGLAVLDEPLWDE